MKDTHATRVSGVVWFKHKYLTNPSATPEDQIIAAIGGLAQTLATGVPPQLGDNTVDKLHKLQEILDPKTGAQGHGTNAAGAYTTAITKTGG